MAVFTQALDEMQADALREVANIGAGHAVTALATMTDEEFNMSVPDVGIRELATFPESLGNQESPAAAVYMYVEGDAPGHAAFIFPHQSAMALSGMLLGRAAGETAEIGEMEASALMEVGNILISSFLNAIADMTSLALIASPPAIAVDMAGAILASILTATSMPGDHVLTIITQMADELSPVDGVFLYIPEPDSLSTLFRALGMEG